MGSPEGRSSKLLAPNADLPKLSPDEVVRLEAENGIRQADRMFELLKHAISNRRFKLRPSILIELNRIAVKGLVASPGVLRVGAMVIEHSSHQPPPHEDVPSYVDDLCDYVSENWATESAIHLAAYVLWRLNWIHPFEDGNGRTARAASYLVLSVHLEAALPGSRTIPEVIASDKGPYYLALEAADEAWKRGELDLTKMEELLKACLAAQLLDVVGRATQGRLKEIDPREAPKSGNSSIPPSLPPPHNRKPRVFVGSSTEGLSVAESLQIGLEYDAEVTIWSQGVFGLASGTLETLTDKASQFDFAVLVLTPDDLVVSRGDEKPAARDNVVFELGLFMGKFGRYRTFIVHPRVPNMHLPSDLAGITTATYAADRSDGDLQAALGPACTKIKRAIRDQGRRE